MMLLAGTQTTRLDMLLVTMTTAPVKRRVCNDVNRREEQGNPSPGFSGFRDSSSQQSPDPVTSRE